MGSSRPEALALTNWRCWYCGVHLTEATATIDHVLPRAFGNKAENNVVAACFPCNNSKGSLGVRKWRKLFETIHRNTVFYGETIGLSLKRKKVAA